MCQCFVDSSIGTSIESAQCCEEYCTNGESVFIGSDEVQLSGDCVQRRQGSILVRIR